MTEQLEPCPFCRNTHLYEGRDDKGGYWDIYINCRCGCRLSVHLLNKSPKCADMSAEDLRKQWNTRAGEPSA